MESSDDEEEVVLQSVTNYYFVDEKEEPVSFSVLSICLDEKEKPDPPKEEVFLHGDGDGGLQKLFKQVTAWRVGLEDSQPEVTVLTKDNKWIKLLKPRKSYEGSIRTILITVQLLHFVRRAPDSSEKSLWDHLRRVLSTFEDRPSVNDLISHYPLIQMIVERDEALAKSQLLLMLLKERPRKISFDEDLQNDSDSKKPFIVDDDLEDIGNDDGDESEEEPDLFDSVCAICDNGGELLCCEGRCMRSFHATRKDGEDSDCKSLGFSRAQVEAIQNFLCRNCKYKQHQCFVCGKLGSSDKSSGAEVFPCVNATCGYFYHPKCVAELQFQENKAEATEYEKKIASGESFTCPVHKCHVCKQGENKEIKELQFAVCRRCPKSYHRKCLPRKIAFEDDETEGVLPRAWEGLLPNRILIYCLKHKIDEDLGTPIRNHIIFEEIPEKRKVTTLQKSKEKVPVKKIRKISDDGSREWASMKPLKTTYKLSKSEESQPVARSGITKQVLNFEKRLKPLKFNTEPDLQKSYGPVSLNTKKSPKEKANAAATSSSIAKVATSSFPKIDVETEKKVIALMENISPSLTRESILQKRTMPSTHSHTARNIDRLITFGKVEGSVEAIKTALRKVEDGSTVEDAKAVCEPDVIKQVIRWNYKLKVYLAPFLHGMRYTSFGRHFTKVDKLKEIVDKLQWYVQNGDMIVDFCCGANDFSRLMKEKLDAAGKKCSFKNYDVIQPKNDFNFEKKDWMEVQTKELPTGSQLIMGLNPPFGVKASLANKFINKALTFKPKILILIVPSETERLDRKRSPYDLIWEDSEKLSGKSFYLPGSVDVNDMQMEQWNNKPPPLYLWSRPDWTTKHKAIALKQGHISQVQQETPAGEECKAQRLNDRPAEERILEVSTKERISEVSAKERISEVPTAKERISDVPARERISEVSAKERILDVPTAKERISDVPARERISEVTARERISDVSARERISEVSAKERISEVSAREVDNKKVATESKKRSSPEDHISRSAKRKRAKRKVHAEAKKKEQEEVKRQDQEQAKRRDLEEAKRRDQEEAKNREREAADTRKEGEQSDMSISPPRTSRDVSASHHPLETFETPGESFQTSTERPSNQRPGLELGAVSEAERKSSVVEDIVDIARRYTTPSSRDALFSSSSLNWSGDRIGNRDYLIRHSEERYPAYSSLDSSSRNAYADGYRSPLDPDTMMLQSRPYGLLGDDDPLRRNRFGSGIPDSALGRRNDTYPSPSYGLPNSMAFPDSALGRNDIFPSSSYGLSGSMAGSATSSYGLSGSMAGSVTSTYGLSGSMAGSVTQRYAPRLDETNTPGAPFPGGRSNMFDPHPVRRDMPPKSFGLAPEPQHPFPRHNSAGWVDD